MPTTLAKPQQSYLRGLCHGLQPVVMIADKGLSENVRHEIDTALDVHELIKVKLRTDREERSILIDRISNDFNAQLIQKIGQVACFYRKNTTQPKLALPS